MPSCDAAFICRNRSLDIKSSQTNQHSTSEATCTWPSRKCLKACTSSSASPKSSRIQTGPAKICKISQVSQGQCAAIFQHWHYKTERTTGLPRLKLPSATPMEPGDKQYIGRPACGGGRRFCLSPQNRSSHAALAMPAFASRRDEMRAVLCEDLQWADFVGAHCIYAEHAPVFLNRSPLAAAQQHIVWPVSVWERLRCRACLHQWKLSSKCFQTPFMNT